MTPQDGLLLLLMQWKQYILSCTCYWILMCTKILWTSLCLLLLCICGSVVFGERVRWASPSATGRTYSTPFAHLPARQGESIWNSICSSPSATGRTKLICSSPSVTGESTELHLLISQRDREKVQNSICSSPSATGRKYGTPFAHLPAWRGESTELHLLISQRDREKEGFRGQNMCYFMLHFCSTRDLFKHA